MYLYTHRYISRYAYEFKALFFNTLGISFALCTQRGTLNHDLCPQEPTLFSFKSVSRDRGVAKTASAAPYLPPGWVWGKAALKPVPSEA